KEAAEAAKRKYTEGFDVQMRESVTIRHQQGAGPNPQPPSGKVRDAITLAEAQRLFREVAARRDVAFRFPTDRCYARSHLMSQELQARGVQAGKVWAFADDDKDPLLCRTNNHPKGYVIWGYHVAPTVRVKQQNGQVQPMVFDPSIFTRPVTARGWGDKIRKGRTHQMPRLDLTRLGEGPKDRNGRRVPGSGYWPGKDPAWGAGTDAREPI